MLLSTTSALGQESYGYAQYVVGGNTYGSAYLATVTRDGTAAASVTYDLTNTSTWGRVRSVLAEDGNYAFRFAGEANNLCTPNPSRTTMIIDRSVTNGTPISCTLDSACGASSQACDSGFCRPYTCQEYLNTTGGVVDQSSPVAITGNCPCGGAQQFAYTNNGVTGVRRIAYQLERDGTRTSFAYDPQARTIGRCENDDATGATFDGTSGTCRDSATTAGSFTSYTYASFGAVQTTLVATESRRSRFAPSAITTTYTYDLTSRRMTQRDVQGLTYDVNGAVVLETQTTQYTYTGGLLTQVIGPAAWQRTDYVYYGSGQGNATGMLQYARRFYGSGATQYLQTAYASYTRLGQPQTITSPASVATSITYDYSGMRTRTRTIAGEVTSYNFTTGGRLTSITDPTGRIAALVYGPLGRIHYIELRDTSGAPSTWDRIHFEYDDAGRRTQQLMERVNSSGTVLSTAYSETATYEAHGFRDTATQGPQSPTTFLYDSTGLGELTHITRGGDGTPYLDENAYDPFQREGNIVRQFGGGSTGQHTFAYTNGSTPEVGDDLPVTVTDPNGQLRTYIWDDFGHLVSSTSEEWRAASGGAGATVRWQYVNGRLAQRVDPSGNVAGYATDTLGRVTSVGNSQYLLNQNFDFAYDNPTGTAVACPSGTSPGINEYACAYRRGRLGLVHVYYNQTQYWTMLYDYAPDGQLGLEQSWDGRQTAYHYDNLGRLARIREPVDFGRDGVAYTYDSTAGDSLDQTEVTAINGQWWDGVTWQPWVTWATSMQRDSAGRLTSMLGSDSAASYPDRFTYRTDGRLASTQIQRRSGTTGVDFVNRTYAYAADGASSGYDSIVSGDVDRTFLMDQSNRLTCTMNIVGATLCPVGSLMVDSFTYGPSDSRTQWITWTGGATTRTYTQLGNSIYQESRGGGTVVTYAYPTATGGGARVSDDDNFAYTSSDTRTYSYDGQGRLRGMVLQRPTGTSPTVQQHSLGVFYDHLTRPILVTDHNDPLNQQQNTAYYYDREDRLIGRIVVPLIGTPNTYTMEWYVPVDPLITGTDRFPVTNGFSGTETLYYTANAPEGLPIGMYSFTRTGSPPTTAVDWRADYGGFGNIRSTTGPQTLPSPWRFRGQIELAGSASIVWNGSTQLQLREPLSMNRWRGYDPHVGQYLSPEPRLMDGTAGAYGGALTHPFAYAAVGPTDFTDSDGRAIDHPVICIYFGAEIRDAATCAFLWLLDHLFSPDPNPDPSRHPRIPGAQQCWVPAGQDGDDHGEPDEAQRCRQALNSCIEECLPSLPAEWPFRRCLNDCMLSAGCPYGPNG